MRLFLIRHLITLGKALVVVAVAFAVFIGISSVEVCRDYAFICENTGSHKGYRQWCLGIRSGRWYRESRLEQFLRQEHPSDLVNRWTSYSGTGRHALGQPIRWGHGRPGPIFEANISLFDRYVDSLDAQAKLDLYRVLASGPPEKVKAEIDRVWDLAFARAREASRSRRDHD